MAPDADDPGTTVVDPYRDLVVGDAGPGSPDRPWVAISAVTSSDGVIAVDGSSRGIGGPADLLALRRIRRGVDAVLVGAATIRAEGYDAALTRPEDVAWRRARGLAPTAALVVASRSLDLGAFGSHVRDTRVILLTAGPEATASAELVARLARNGSTLEVLDAGTDGRLDWRVGLARLHAAGLRRLSCEGGPSVNAQLLAAGLVDEVFLTIAPRILGAGAGATTMVGFAGAAPLAGRLRLLQATVAGDELLVRYGAPGGAG
jgi:riboflavin biosynthesis pyrimidine reductase